MLERTKGANAVVLPPDASTVLAISCECGRRREARWLSFSEAVSLYGLVQVTMTGPRVGSFHISKKEKYSGKDQRRARLAGPSQWIGGHKGEGRTCLRGHLSTPVKYPRYSPYAYSPVQPNANGPHLSC
jgi:hypothetical protein